MDRFFEHNWGYPLYVPNFRFAERKADGTFRLFDTYISDRMLSPCTNDSFFRCEEGRGASFTAYTDTGNTEVLVHSQLLYNAISKTCAELETSLRRSRIHLDVEQSRRFYYALEKHELDFDTEREMILFKRFLSGSWCLCPKTTNIGLLYERLLFSSVYNILGRHSFDCPQSSGSGIGNGAILNQESGAGIERLGRISISYARWPETSDLLERRIGPWQRGKQIIAAILKRKDDQAGALIRENPNFRTLSPIEPAIREGDFEAVRLLRSQTYALSSAARDGNFNLVVRLLRYGADPNDGPNFLERPLQTAIIHDRLEVARYLLQQRAVADLGDLLSPLCGAVLRGNLAEARNILQKPRTLVSETAKDLGNSKYGQLRQIFRLEHDLFLEKSCSIESSSSFNALGISSQDCRAMWKEGMSALRRLNKERRPKNFGQTLSLLIVASAMRKASQSKDEFGNLDLFIDDLDRWRCLAIDEQERALFDEVVRAMWGKVTVIDDPRDAQDYEQDLRELVKLMKELTTDIVGNSSASIVDAAFFDCPPSEKTAVTLKKKKTKQNRDPNLYPHQTPSEGNTSPIETCQVCVKLPLHFTTHGEWDPASKVALMLMLGAIFAVIMKYLLTTRILSNVFPISDSIAPKTAEVLDLLESESVGIFPNFCRFAKKLIQGGKISCLLQLRISLLSEIAPEAGLDELNKIYLENDIDYFCHLFVQALSKLGLRDRCISLVSSFNLSIRKEEDFFGLADHEAFNERFFMSTSSSASSDGEVSNISNSSTATSTPQVSPSANGVRDDIIYQVKPSSVSPLYHNLKCKDCPRVFRTTTNLNRHAREKHTNNPPIYRCTKGCGSSFTRNEYRKIHEVERCLNKNLVLESL